MRLHVKAGVKDIMNIYIPKPDAENDYVSIRRNGMWYQNWQGGYSDIIKKGYKAPEDPETVLAELHSPNIDDFLHGGSGNVPFLISERVKEIFEKNQISGYRLANVEIAKISTKGKRKKTQQRGEPEDSILKATNKIKDVSAPKLYAVYVSGRVDAHPDYPSGRTPDDYVSPFELIISDNGVPDLFRPRLNGEDFSAWTFCSEKFQTTVVAEHCTNIRFQRFSEFMKEFRSSVSH